MKHNKPPTEELPTSTPWNKGKKTMSTEKFKLEELSAVMPIMRMGRFAELKVDIKRDIATTPVGEFFLLNVSWDVARSEKEKTAIKNAITGMFVDQKLPWVIKWTTIKQAFIVVRRADWEAQKRHSL